MREMKFGDKPRRPALVRGADGRIKLASERGAIDDIWAEQQRIKLAEAIKSDELSAKRVESRKAFLGRAVRRLKVLAKKTVGPIMALSKRQKFVVSGGLVIAALALIVSVLGIPWAEEGKRTAITDTKVLNAETQIPAYSTILPAGKTIEDLGGWGRVSPANRDPVFAYADNIEGVHVTVSEQPLPNDFKDDIGGSVSNLAKQFSATDEVTANDVTFYIGTSIKGPQSVIFSKNGLLLLIKSDTKLTHQQWADYIAKLH